MRIEHLRKRNREDSNDPLETKTTVYVLYMYALRRTVQTLEARVLNLDLPQLCFSELRKKNSYSCYQFSPLQDD